MQPYFCCQYWNNWKIHVIVVSVCIIVTLITRTYTDSFLKAPYSFSNNGNMLCMAMQGLAGLIVFLVLNSRPHKIRQVPNSRDIRSHVGQCATDKSNELRNGLRYFVFAALGMYILTAFQYIGWQHQTVLFSMGCLWFGDSVMPAKILCVQIIGALFWFNREGDDHHSADFAWAANTFLLVLLFKYHGLLSIRGAAAVTIASLSGILRLCIGPESERNFEWCFVEIIAFSLCVMVIYSETDRALNHKVTSERFIDFMSNDLTSKWNLGDLLLWLVCGRSIGACVPLMWLIVWNFVHMLVDEEGTYLVYLWMRKVRSVAILEFLMLTYISYTMLVLSFYEAVKKEIISRYSRRVNAAYTVGEDYYPEYIVYDMEKIHTLWRTDKVVYADWIKEEDTAPSSTIDL